MHKKRASGFSLVELVIVIVIIGVIAAIAIPRVTQASKGASDTALKGNLSVLRNAIELYAGEHNGLYPGAKAPSGLTDGTPEAFKAQLTMFTDADGETSVTKDVAHPLGPYLAKDIPPVMIGENATSNTVSVKTTAAALATDVAGGYGWIYNCTTGEIIANSDKTNEAGKAYKEF